MRIQRDDLDILFNDLFLGMVSSTIDREQSLMVGVVLSVTFFELSLKHCDGFLHGGLV